MTGLSRFGTSNRYKLVLVADIRRSCVKYLSGQSILLHSTDMVEPAQLLDINTPHNVYVVEELIPLTIASDAEISPNSH